jgi:hypothetical protein
MPETLLYCDYEEQLAPTQSPYHVLNDVDTSCHNEAKHLIYQELSAEDIGEENPYDMLSAGAILACDDHVALMAQEIMADGMASDVGLFVIEFKTVNQLR